MVNTRLISVKMVLNYIQLALDREHAYILNESIIRLQEKLLQVDGQYRKIDTTCGVTIFGERVTALLSKKFWNMKGIYRKSVDGHKNYLATNS